MCSKQNTKKELYNGNQDSGSDRSETKRKRQYSTQSHDTEVSCMSQETATTGVSFETDSDISETKLTSGRSVSFCLANDNEDMVDGSCNDSVSRDAQMNNGSHNVHKTNKYETMDYTNEEIGQERVSRNIIYHPINISRKCSQNSCNEENCRQPLLQRQSTFSRGTMNEHLNDSEHGFDHAHVQGNFTNSVHPCVCKLHYSQCEKLCSSVKLLKRIVFVLCAVNIILLVALIVVPTFTVIYIQASRESNPGTGQLPSSSEQQKPESSCLTCESVKNKFPNFKKMQTLIDSIGYQDGKCCFSDPGKLMVTLIQVLEEAIERAKDSVSSSGPWISNGSELTPAVHLKSRGNGLINVSIDFIKEGIDSTHFVGWQRRASQREAQGLWGEVNKDGASIRVKSSGMYFVYTMIQHKNTINSSVSDNMTTASYSRPPFPPKVTLYVCQHAEDGVKDIFRISQMYYYTEYRVQQNAYFGRIVHLKENDNIYLGISGYGFIHQESESHYIGFYKI